ncbi:RNA polymerase sigma-70 factor, ECF subfamily [Mucilaginibacter mallensis]|uniref:RNA polymerase sigma-70 factor, ECF subfamily n=1 Tax=Mucilaginibacter mallensis TaxID=652787 RepID=A0A1H1TZN5_MUCMA|nr:RNA polymerase sigma-70 factor [Mucilaginibacter mallensis]SDS65687.1 RNA polymerase sigma-70 factor, ECF subfamily [Mucilaginibacter mallensis]
MEFKNLPDHILIHECRIGNAKAFDILFERYFNKLHFFSLKYLKDRALAEEMVMDIMVKLWEKKEAFTTEVSIGPYLFRSMKNAIVDHYRKKGFKTVLLEQSHEKLSMSNSAENNLAFEELHKIYHTNLEKLSPQRRRVFEMSRHENMTYPEIARHLNLSVKTVESHISASLVHLRKSLNIYTDVLLVIIPLIYFF